MWRRPKTSRKGQQTVKWHLVTMDIGLTLIGYFLQPKHIRHLKHTHWGVPFIVYCTGGDTCMYPQHGCQSATQHQTKWIATQSLPILCATIHTLTDHRDMSNMIRLRSSAVLH